MTMAKRNLWIILSSLLVSQSFKNIISESHSRKRVVPKFINMFERITNVERKLQLIIAMISKIILKRNCSYR